MGPSQVGKCERQVPTRCRAVHVSEVNKVISHRNEHAHQPSFLQGTQHCALLTLASGLCNVSVSVANSPSRSTKTTQSVVGAGGEGGGEEMGGGGQSWGRRLKGGCVCVGRGWSACDSIHVSKELLPQASGKYYFPSRHIILDRIFKGHLLII